MIRDMTTPEPCHEFKRLLGAHATLSGLDWGLKQPPYRGTARQNPVHFAVHSCLHPRNECWRMLRRPSGRCQQRKGYGQASAAYRATKVVQAFEFIGAFSSILCVPPVAQQYVHAIVWLTPPFENAICIGLTARFRCDDSHTYFLDERRILRFLLDPPFSPFVILRTCNLFVMLSRESFAKLKHDRRSCGDPGYNDTTRHSHK